jgi:hypothetical protein
MPILVFRVGIRERFIAVLARPFLLSINRIIGPLNPLVMVPAVRAYCRLLYVYFCLFHKIPSNQLIKPTPVSVGVLFIICGGAAYCHRYVALRLFQFPVISNPQWA